MILFNSQSSTSQTHSGTRVLFCKSCPALAVFHEADATWEYLPAESPTQLNSGTCGTGQKACYDCNQFDCTCRIVTTAFDAWGDVTGGVWDSSQRRSGRSHRRCTSINRADPVCRCTPQNKRNQSRCNSPLLISFFTKDGYTVM